MKNHLLLCFLLVLIGCNDKTTNTNPQKKAKESKAIKETPKPEPTQKKTLVFFGNSLTAAYGLDPAQGFVQLIGNKIDSLGLDYNVVNAGLSGETSAGGNSRIDWVLRQKIDVFVLELGANDGLRGTSTEETYKNLSSIIQKVKIKYASAKIVICAMEALPNMGAQFTTDFRAIFARLAKESNATLIPFFLSNVGGIPELNQADGIHPTAKGHQIVSENIWAVLKDVI